MKKKSILKGASFFLATFAFCGVMALGAKYISPRHEVNTTIETQVAYAEELATLDKTLWEDYKETYKNDILNVRTITTATNTAAQEGDVSIGNGVYARISGETLTIFSTINDSKIILPEDCTQFFYKQAWFEEDDEYIYSYFGKITTMDLSNFDTSNVTNMSGMFLACQALTSLDVSGFNTSNVTNMGSMFSSCEALTSLDLSGFDTSKVEIMEGMFYLCQSLTSLDLSGFNTGNVTNMSYMFNYCPALTSLNVSGFDTTNVTNMACMFMWCVKLVDVDLSSFSTSNVVHMLGMFYGCNALTSLDVSGFDTSNVTSMEGMFSGCNDLTSLDLSGFDTSKVKNMEGMFRVMERFEDNGIVYSDGISKLRQVDLSSFDMTNVTNANDMFYGCDALVDIVMPKALPSDTTLTIDLPATYGLTNDNYQTTGTRLNTFPVSTAGNKQQIARKIADVVVQTNSYGSVDTSSVERFAGQEVTTNGNQLLFDGVVVATATPATIEGYTVEFDSWDLTALASNNTVTANFTVTAHTTLDKTLWEDYKETYKNDILNVRIITTATNTAAQAGDVSIGDGVYARISGETLTIFSINDSKIILPADCSEFFYKYAGATINDEWIYSYFEKITTIDISNFITSQVTDIHRMFYGCNSLKVVDLSSFDLTNVNTNQLFDGCENLSMIYLPKALPQGYDVELGSDLVLASNHAVKGSTLNAFAGYESTAGQKNAIVKGGEVNVVVDTQFADVISTGEEIEYYYGDEIVVNGTTLIIGGVSVQVVPNEVEGYEITFAGWEGIENGVVVGDTITAILTKTPINYTITMIVNGQNNTRTYNIETNTFTLEEPEGGEEEEFVGWTWEGQEVPVKDLEILKGSIGDRTVKANFAPKTYTITINVDGEITTIDYTKGSDDIVIKDPSSSGLIFDGWVDENGNKVDENVIKSGSTGDRYFKATWKKSPMLKYVAIGVLAFVGVAVATEIIVGVLVKKKKK